MGEKGGHFECESLGGDKIFLRLPVEERHASVLSLKLTYEGTDLQRLCWMERICKTAYNFLTSLDFTP